MINTIRTYFLNRVQEVDANLIDYRTDVFANNAPEGYETRKYFNLSIGNCVPRRIDNTYVDSFNVTLDVLLHKQETFMESLKLSTVRH